jgi:hypothetical protein
LTDSNLRIEQMLPLFWGGSPHEQGSRRDRLRRSVTTLTRALAEFGRIIKTPHMLGYIDSKEKRRRILTPLNRQEFRHRLARRVCHGDRGEIRKTCRREQEEQLGALGLTLNAIAPWKSTYIRAATDQLVLASMAGRRPHDGCRGNRIGGHER